MSKFAFLDEFNRIVDIIEGDNSNDHALLEQQYSSTRNLKCKRVFSSEEQLHNSSNAKGRAILGGYFDEDLNAFISPKPSAEYELDKELLTWVLPNESLTKEARAKRDRLLTESDWVTIRATDTGTPVPSDWQTYRQALRDITEQTGFPENIDWPEKPES